MLNKHASPARSSIYQDGREGLDPVHSVHKTTAIAYNRAKCLGENEQADRITFENRVQEIMQMKNTGTVLNARVIETWINETLADAEHLDIPGVICKPQNKAPLVRYQVDRLFLNNAGVPEVDIDRIYRGLFVYSIGFYEMIHKCLTHAQNKYTILSSFWKVFSILLEYCCRSNYQMMISKITTEHQEAIAKLEAEARQEKEYLNSHEKELKVVMDQYQKENGDLKKKNEEEVLLRKKLQEEIYKSIKTHEEEVQLRLQFEGKLNGLHSLHRDL